MKSFEVQRDVKLFGDEIIGKFISGDKKVLRYIDSFYSTKNIAKHSENKIKNYKVEQREILIKSIKNQYSKIHISKKTSNNISSLIKSNTFCITTGHQLNLFTGPLMVIFKIAQVISICKKLNSEIKNFNYVPILWIASEDHDFEEISQLNINQKNIKWEINSDNKPVGELEVNNFGNLLSEYKDLIIDNNFKQKLEKIIDNSYEEGDKLSKSTIKFINSLFSEYGLIIVDANNKNLKNFFKTHLKNEIDNFSCRENTTFQITKLKKDFESYKAQVNPSDINFFKLTSKGRKRIRYNNKTYNVDDENLYSKDEILNLIDKRPELFSPNAIMRPLYQETVLPNVCYVGGQNELKYWMQLKTYFDDNDVQFPILKLRNSAYIIDSKTSKKIKNSGIDFKYFLGDLDKLINYKIEMTSSFKINFDSLRSNLSLQFDQLRKVSSKTDKSFTGALNAQEKKQKKGIDDLEKRLNKAEKKNYKAEIESLKSIYNFLHPENIDQERYLNFGNFYSSKGPLFIEYIVEKISIMDDKILVIDLED
tara:strand:- start:3895 stop:5502 length:1608 start_codon:yes stop_codon:yes gene_type:complete